ncbi:RHOMBOID-like protein 9, chloroplastic [Dioscorea cayenensis subsp. rotundata]|uniref:RHOMBOID-like protein 9, chloroplastic n=1 Tax=Dioscorea cayennensis subsp. rotundata TaxID=55577 RepID=A0AB40CSF1_DIOCR|nr:RHOMBOID-like protein 9, chloroplastic [Dioscorea cayenensis subsp. rotundata]
MAVVSICPRISRVYLGSNSVVSSEKRRFLVSSRGLNVLHVKLNYKFYLNAKKMERFDGVDGVGIEKESGSNEEQLRVLDSYFGKLQGNTAKNQASVCKGEVQDIKVMVENGEKKKKMVTGLGSLENYFGKLKFGKTVERNKTSLGIGKETSDRNSVKLMNSAAEAKMKMEAQNYIGLETKDSDENFQELPAYDEASDFWLISILAAINIGVFLFEIASPIRDSDIEHLSLPLIYGAKINKLILDGEWWRLFTPMFLHSGFLHVCLGCWVLLSFAPQVCRGYGLLTFFLIYVLGGVCGNLTSFIHTPELTVCGTGPTFAIIGAWFVYQIQNKAVIPESVTESMLGKAVIATTLSFVLSNFERIDDWTHLGAMFSGIIFGFLTCPSLQLDNVSPKTTQKEGIALVQRQADPCKSLLTFTLCLLLLSLIVLNFEPQNEMLELDGFIN